LHRFSSSWFDAAAVQRVELVDGWFCQHSFSLLLSVVVVAPAHVLVRERKCRLLVGGRDAIESVLEDRLDVPVRPRPHPQRTVARCLKSHFAVTLAEPQNAQARAKALLGVRIYPPEACRRPP